MKKNEIVSVLLIFLLFAITNGLSSCAAPKDVTYLRNLPDSGKIESNSLPEFHPPLIQPDDILSISIQTIDPQINAIVNQPSLTTSTPSATSSSGYLVNKNGFIEYPLLGQIKVTGLSTYDAAEVIKKSASQYLKSPTVQVRFLNYKITVLGEVNRPGTYTVPNEKVSVLDVIGLASDLTIYGKRDNILIIHEKGGKQEYARVNLTSSNFIKSPDYYLQPNDIVYVEPNKARIAVNNASKVQITTIVVSLLSLIVVLVTRIK